jgi:predicted acylesterase/phospholipase RssA
MATTYEWVSQPSRIGVVVSGGAPTLHLAAGALCAFYDKEVSFDVVGASGAGALPALLYMAPKTGNPASALKNVVNLNVYDAIYDLLPSNYKVFFKYGRFSSIFWQLGRMLPRFTLTPETRFANAPQRLHNDVLDLMLTAITPTTLNYWSKSVLTRVPVVDDLVDWASLKSHSKKFFLNAFNFTTRDLEVFDNQKMTPEAFYAALAMPWLFPPTEAHGTLYTKGASHDPCGLEALHENQGPQISKLEAIVILDTIVPEMWTDPESVLEALELSIFDPIVTLNENIAALASLQDLHFDDNRLKLPKIYRLPFEVSAWERVKLLEWSYTNALRLWDVGYHAAEMFCQHAPPGFPMPTAPLTATPGRVGAEAPAPAPTQPAAPTLGDQEFDKKYRYLRSLEPGSRADRVDDFLALFGSSVAEPQKGSPPPVTQSKQEGAG